MMSNRIWPNSARGNSRNSFSKPEALDYFAVMVRVHREAGECTDEDLRMLKRLEYWVVCVLDSQKQS